MLCVISKKYWEKRSHRLVRKRILQRSYLFPNFQSDFFLPVRSFVVCAKCANFCDYLCFFPGWFLNLVFIPRSWRVYIRWTIRRTVRLPSFVFVWLAGKIRQTPSCAHARCRRLTDWISRVCEWSVARVKKWTETNCSSRKSMRGEEYYGDVFGEVCTYFE